MSKGRRLMGCALLSVYDKQGIKEVAASLQRSGVVLYASGGTHRYLQKEGISAHALEEITGYDALLGGRVKTLHPDIFAGLLYRERIGRRVCGYFLIFWW